MDTDFGRARLPDDVTPRRRPGSADVLAPTDLQTRDCGSLLVASGIIRESRPTKLTLHLFPQVIHLRQGQRREVQAARLGQSFDFAKSVGELASRGLQ
jgi:hypothetical protein